jgi:hypothetical protein
MVTRGIVLGSEFDHLADDQGETLGNASYHQDAAIDARECLRAYGQWRGLPWFVSYQTPLAIRGAGTPHPATVTPDVFVHTTRGTDPFDVLDVEREGPPALIVEVLNPATAPSTDLNPQGKLGAYEAMGVAEYLTFDPIGELDPEQVRAWRLGPDGTYAPWEPTAAWRWQSALGIAFAPQGWRLRVFDDAGTPIPHYDEIALCIQEQAEVQAAQERELAALRAELARLRDGESQ